ncbi:uncharacterized protein Dvar_01500 [Desulfosarcina variabilis str. Montpellier]|uniref:hypothetical protein n=1 Tax=Desulfosarcina variabilis TaxID=2300 RepID=UPI003AFB2F99
MNILLINPPNCGHSIPEENYRIKSIKMIFRGEPLSFETLALNKRNTVKTNIAATRILKDLGIRIDNLDYYTFTNAVTSTRMAEAQFYQSYAALLEHCLSRVHSSGAHAGKEIA